MMSLRSFTTVQRPAQGFSLQWRCQCSAPVQHCSLHARFSNQH
jgi:hypothetical protein